MIKNLGYTRNSADDINTINGSPYIDVARAYYNSTMYEDELQAISNVYNDILPVFNAVPKVVNIASALSIGGTIEPANMDKEYVKNIIKNLTLEQEKAFMARELILGKSILIELQLEPYEGEEPIDTNFMYNMSYYSSDEYEVISVGQEIYYAKITGVQFVMNDERTAYVEKEIEKIFIKDVESGTARSYIVDSEGNESNQIDYQDGKLPLVEITTTYDMKQLFYSIDRHNEFESFIRSILYLAGEPIIAGIGLDKIQKQAQDNLAKDRMKKQKTLFTRTETAKLQLLEITGASARVMIEKQEGIVNNIIKDYPEYSISEVLSGSNVSEETTRIRLTEILSRVSELRENIERGFNQLIGLVAFFDGKEIEEKYITLGNMIDSNTKEVLETMELALNNGLISRRSAMCNIKELFEGQDVDKELEQIANDKEEAIKNAQKMMNVTGNNDEQDDDKEEDDEQGSTNGVSKE